MSLTVTTPAQARRLTRREHVTAEVGSADPALLDRLIDAATSAIESYCHRRFGREAVSELVPGWDALELQLSRTPLIAVTSVLFDTEPITDWSIESRDEGTLYRRLGWGWTTQRDAGLTGRQRWPGFGAPLPRREEPRFTVSYVGGHILPEQNLEGVTSRITVSAVDDSFNDSGNGFPALLRAGDVVVTSGFTAPEDNGRFLVTGTPTPSKIQVSASLATETPAGPITVSFEPPAECRPLGDVEKACIEAVKAWYLTRSQASSVVERQVGGLRVRYSETDDALMLGLPPICVGLLRPWVRYA